MQTPSIPGRRRPPAAALVIVLLLLGTAPFAVPPVQDAVSGIPVDFAHVEQPLSYLIGAPLFGIWDTLSLLTLSQHYAVLVTLVILYVSARILTPKRPLRPLGRLAAEVGWVVVGLAALLAFYAAGLLLPRPMVGLGLEGSDLLSVDFHSHTRYSHDGWSLFSPRRNRAWHEAGGFDVGYVTDHYTWRGYDEAARDNPERAGERTTLLSGAEVRIHLRPTNILGARERYLFALDSDTTYMEPDSLAAAFARGGPPPTLLYTMPGHLQYVVPFTDSEPSGVIGIELNDGSPRGLEQVKAQRAEILALADSADLAVVAAANLHGWGRTVAAWSVLRIPGWRDMSPARLGDAIEAELHDKRRDAVVVVERRMPYHGESNALLALTLPRIIWEHFRMLTLVERCSWLVWLVVVVVAGRAGARRRARRVAVPSAG